MKKSRPAPGHHLDHHRAAREVHHSHHHFAALELASHLIVHRPSFLAARLPVHGVRRGYRAHGRFIRRLNLYSQLATRLARLLDPGGRFDERVSAVVDQRSARLRLSGGIAPDRPRPRAAHDRGRRGQHRPRAPLSRLGQDRQLAPGDEARHPAHARRRVREADPADHRKLRRRRRRAASPDRRRDRRRDRPRGAAALPARPDPLRAGQGLGQGSARGGQGSTIAQRGCARRIHGRPGRAHRRHDGPGTVHGRPRRRGRRGPRRPQQRSGAVGGLRDAGPVRPRPRLVRGQAPRVRRNRGLAQGARLPARRGRPVRHRVRGDESDPGVHPELGRRARACTRTRIPTSTRSRAASSTSPIARSPRSRSARCASKACNGGRTTCTP